MVDSAVSGELDKTDLKILRLLQSDGRMGNAEIAKRVNTSAATCHRRTQRLFVAGYISAVRAQIVPHKVGRGTLVIVGVVLDRSTPESFAATAATIRVWFDCTPPIETSVSALLAIMSGTMYSSFRSLLPPKARPELQSSRLA